MTTNVLVNLDFHNLIMEAKATTTTGSEIINKFQKYLMTNEASCDIVNSFIREASKHVYDNGINETLSVVSDYIQSNKVSWALASACESIMANESNFNALNRKAAEQVTKLLEQEEDNVVKYIRSGALKNVMYCESFRNIAKSVFACQPIIEAKADYTKITPISLVESVSDGYCFEICGNLYKVDDANNIVEAQWNEVSNTFKTVSSLLESNMTECDGDKISVKFGDAEYIIESSSEIHKISIKENRLFTIDEFRDYTNLVLQTSNPRYKTNVACIMESIALLAENYDKVVALDNSTIYQTKNDRFLVIESDSNIYATLLASTRHPKWSINENAVDALSFIKTKTNVELGEEYGTVVENCMDKIDEEKKQAIATELKENQEKSIKERIELLTEKFKDDPVKLRLLAKLAVDSQAL